MAARTFYGWEQDGKVYLSALPRTQQSRPALELATRDAAEIEVRKRRGRLEWEDDGK